jgi:hypothetical protein
MHNIIVSYTKLLKYSPPMMWIVAVATDVSDVRLYPKHFTTVPFRALLTGLTVILDISGKINGPESLEKVIVEVLILSG